MYIFFFSTYKTRIHTHTHTYTHTHPHPYPHVHGCKDRCYYDRRSTEQLDCLVWHITHLDVSRLRSVFCPPAKGNLYDFRHALIVLHISICEVRFVEIVNTGICVA